jgi:hypothetical protein
MAQIDCDPNRILYHGTLSEMFRPLETPDYARREGTWTARLHPDAAALDTTKAPEGRLSGFPSRSADFTLSYFSGLGSALIKSAHSQ